MPISSAMSAAERLVQIQRLESEDRHSEEEQFKVNPNVEKSEGPIDELALHGLAGEFIKLMTPHSEADPIALLIQTLICFGNIINRKPYVDIEGSKHHMNLFAVLVGKTSSGRKGTSWGRVRSLFEDVDPEWYRQSVVTSLSTGEGLIARAKDPDESELESRTREKRILVNTGEFATILKVMAREGNTLSPVVRDAWDGIKLGIYTKNNPITASDAHISIVGHITQMELLKNLPQVEAANGFGNRFLWFRVGRSKLLPESSNPDPSALETIKKRLRQSIEFSFRQGEIRLSYEASNLWTMAYMTQLNEERHGLSGAMTGRGPPIVRRLAVIYALLDESSRVEKEHLEAALAVWDYSLKSCGFIFGNTFGNVVADRIYQKLKSFPLGLSRTDIVRNVFSNNIQRTSLDNAVELLCKEGVVKVHEIIDSASGRKKSLLKLTSFLSETTNLTNSQQ